MCHLNVVNDLGHEERSQFGWSLLQYESNGVKEPTFMLEAHSVVRQADGRHRDVTPGLEGETVRHFVPDDGLTSECIVMNNFPLLVTMCNDKALQGDFLKAAFGQSQAAGRKCVFRSTTSYAKLMS